VTPSKFLAAACAVAALLFALQIGWAVRVGGGLIDGFARVADEPWGLVGLTDLYLGFAATGAWMIAVERRRAVGIALALSLPFLGNIVTLCWLAVRAWRAPSLREALLGSR